MIKHISSILIIAVALIITLIVGGIFFYNKDNSGISPEVPKSISVITGDGVKEYQGLANFASAEDNTVPVSLRKFDVSKYPRIDVVNLRHFNARMPKKDYVVFSYSPVSSSQFYPDVPNYNINNGTQEILLIFQPDGKTFEGYPFPESPWWSTSYYQWVGDNVFIHYFSYFGLTSGDKFYMFDMASRKFVSMNVDKNDFRSETTNLPVYALPDTKNDNYFAIAYCNKSGTYGLGCSKYSFGISDSKSIKKVFDLDWSDFTSGWKDEKFFVKNHEGTKVYVVDPRQLVW